MIFISICFIFHDFVVLVRRCFVYRLCTALFVFSILFRCFRFRLSYQLRFSPNPINELDIVDVDIVDSEAIISKNLNIFIFLSFCTFCTCSHMHKMNLYASLLSLHEDYILRARTKDEGRR